MAKKDEVGKGQNRAPQKQNPFAKFKMGSDLPKPGDKRSGQTLRGRRPAKGKL